MCWCVSSFLVEMFKHPATQGLETFPLQNKKTPVQRLPVDLHQGEPRITDMADYNSRWTTRQSKTRQLPDSCHKLLTHLKKDIKIQTDQTKEYPRRGKLLVLGRVRAVLFSENSCGLRSHVEQSHQRLPSPSPNSINVTKVGDRFFPKKSFTRISHLAIFPLFYRLVNFFHLACIYLHSKNGPQEVSTSKPTDITWSFPTHWKKTGWVQTWHTWKSSFKNRTMLPNHGQLYQSFDTQNKRSFRKTGMVRTGMVRTTSMFGALVYLCTSQA